MKNIITLFLSLLVSTISFSQLNLSQVGLVDYGSFPGPWSMTDVWGYVAPDGTEYALVGLPDGVSILDLSIPDNPVESVFVNGVTSFWRDIKTWGEFAYVSTEASTGIQVIDLSKLPTEATSFNWKPNISELGGTLNSAHNIWIDEFGFLYISGSNLNSGGVIFADLSDPGNPVYAGHSDARYSHDAFVRNNLLFSSEIFGGVLSVIEVTDKAKPVLLATQTTPGFFTHNAWLSDDGNYVFTTDEEFDAPVAAYDISDLDNIQPMDTYRPYATLGTGVVPHNVLVWQNWLVIAHYTDGVILVDATRPENLVEIGNFDTFPGAGGGFGGVWGVYPYLPSGLILASDDSGKLFILEPNYVRACYLEGKVTDAVTGENLVNAEITIEGTPALEKTDLLGDYKTGLATAGTYTVPVSKVGYEPFTAEVLLENGEITILDVELTPLVGIAISGQVLDSETGEAVGDASVLLVNENFTFETTTDPSGDFALDNFQAGTYTVYAGKWGYTTSELTEQELNPSNTSVSLEIKQEIKDVFALDLGWTVEGDATSGAWELAIPPVGIPVPLFPDEFLSPNEDSEFDIGNGCFVTGNDLIPNSLVGTTRLISPPFGFTSDEGDPRMRVITWMVSLPEVALPPPAPGPEKLYIIVSNGFEEVIIDSVGSTGSLSTNWRLHLPWKLKDYIELTQDMRVIFEVSNTDGGFLEAGIDNFRVWGGNLTDSDEPEDSFARMTVFPNPSSTSFSLQYDLKNKKEEATLLVFNVLGQQVEEQSLQSAAGTISVGTNWREGVYFLQIQNGEHRSRSFKVVKN